LDGKEKCAMGAPFIIDLRRRDGTFPQANKIEGWKGGWFEYCDPLTHGGCRTRRFFKDATGMTFWTEYTIPANIFKDPYTAFCCSYISPSGYTYFVGNREDAMFSGDEPNGCINYFTPESMEADPRLLKAMTGEDGKRPTMKDVLFDMYGVWDILHKVDDEEHAIRVATLMSRRAQILNPTTSKTDGKEK
jgi:hypothetical protein